MKMFETFSTLLLADAVDKGGPGSGPHAGGEHLSPLANHTGKRVTVDHPVSEHHGKNGIILRQMGNESGVEIQGMDHMAWIKTEHLKES